MAAVYHINGDSVSPCRAQKGMCPFGKGEENNHFSDAGEAMAVLEYRFAKEYGAVPSGTSKGADINRGVAVARGMDTHEYDKRVAAGEKPEAVAAAAKSPTAKDLAAKGADPKAIRDALRKENPTWDARRVHTVASQMMGGKPGAKKTAAAPAAPAPSKVDEKALHNNWKKATDSLADLRAANAKLHANSKKHDELHGVAEGRAYHIGDRGERVDGPSPDPRRGTYYKPHPSFKQAREDIQAKIAVASKAERDGQTAIEEAGLGHTIPDDGKVLRVRTQAQKWLLENELKGQISDGQWENSGPQDHWQDWTDARVVVDPQNVGRNFYAKKDNYQLNAKSLLDVVGDRMVEDVKATTGKDYDEKAMANDLKDLRSIFKTSRPRLKN